MFCGRLDSDQQSVLTAFFFFFLFFTSGSADVESQTLVCVAQMIGCCGYIYFLVLHFLSNKESELKCFWVIEF